jgi:hypothetical protein
MSARLRLAYWWLPRFLMVREIDRIRIRTNNVLDDLIRKNGGAVPEEIGGNTGRSLEDRRMAMARGHELRAKALIDIIGQEEAVRIAREALFTAGQKIGQETQARLGVSESKDDLIKAARVMYRILGINFVIVDQPTGERMEVHHCALAGYYSHQTCLMFSAIDEGVVSGLSSRMRMTFTKHMTGGAARCVAIISEKEER